MKPLSFSHLFFAALLTPFAGLAFQTADASTPQVSQTAVENTLGNLENAQIRPNASGFYPLWENTAAVEHHQGIFIGTTGAQFGILNRAQIGTNFLSYIYRTPNLSGKLRLGTLTAGGEWKISVGASYHHLLEGASRALFSPMYNSRIDNPDFSVHLASLQMIASHEPAGWVRFHHTLTTLGTFDSGPLQSQAHLGYSLVTELEGRKGHSVLLHAGEVGFWDHDFSVLGISYRFQGRTTELRAGYFYRMTDSGVEHSPLVGLGFNL